MTIDCLDHLDQYVGFYCVENDYLITAAFEPLTGASIKSGLYSYFTGVLCREFHNKEKGNKRAIKKRVLERIEEWKNSHTDAAVCPRLYDLGLGEDAGTTRAYYLPMIRAYVVYKQYIPRGTNSYSFGDFYTMEYCPFCGAKLPSSLERELTEILQKEYGLSSWRDYKKAPKEFHTDEWWKKRGL